MARSKPVYRGERSYGWIVTLAVTVLVLLILVAAWLFFDLQQYIVYDKDGIYLASPGNEGVFADNGGGSQAAVRQLPLIDVEIVVDKTDYSAAAGTDGAGLEALRGRFIPAENVTASTLNSYTYGLGDYNALVLELKPSSGLLSWKSTVPLADSYGVNGEFDMTDYIARLKENGAWLVAQLSCLLDGTMAVRNSPAALRDAEGSGLYIADGQAWMDPYNTVTREYLAALMQELHDMGFDEILLTGLYLPEDGTFRFGGDMTETPDGASAVSSLALYLRAQADTIGIRLSAAAERRSLVQPPEGQEETEAAAVSQDLSVFFKAFDRVAYAADYDYASGLAALETARSGGGDGGVRIVPVLYGRVPDHQSYIVR